MRKLLRMMAGLETNLVLRQGVGLYWCLLFLYVSWGGGGLLVVVHKSTLSSVIRMKSWMPARLPRDRKERWP
jgi:hypothetical protein